MEMHQWDRTLPCKMPKIKCGHRLMRLFVCFQFYPSTGPLKGGTQITIEGENLGKMFDDIRAGVMVANRKCITDHFDQLYEPARR